MADTPFDGIESAQEYVQLLASETDNARAAIQTDIDEAMPTRKERHLDALRLVDYKLKQLSGHLGACRRILNDLRMLRRLLLDEQAAEDGASAAPARSLTSVRGRS